jgi:hypothetical protein
MTRAPIRTAPAQDICDRHAKVVRRDEFAKKLKRETFGDFLGGMFGAISIKSTVDTPKPEKLAKVLSHVTGNDNVEDAIGYAISELHFAAARLSHSAAFIQPCRFQSRVLASDRMRSREWTDAFLPQQAH